MTDAIDMNASKADQGKLFVRVATSHWSDERGLHCRRDITILKRKSNCHDFLSEDAHMVGANETWERITNIGEIEDGVYQVVTCNESKDWETGIVDDYDFKLIKVE